MAYGYEEQEKIIAASDTLLRLTRSTQTVAHDGQTCLVNARYIVRMTTVGDCTCISQAGEEFTIWVRESIEEIIALMQQAKEQDDFTMEHHR